MSIGKSAYSKLNEILVVNMETPEFFLRLAECFEVLAAFLIKLADESRFDKDQQYLISIEDDLTHKQKALLGLYSSGSHSLKAS